MLSNELILARRLPASDLVFVDQSDTSMPDRSGGTHHVVLPSGSCTVQAEVRTYR